MYRLTKIIVDETQNVNSGFILGGKKGYVSKWPLNPNGESLLHLFSIDCKKLSDVIPNTALPKFGYLSVFSTYSDSNYFLDDVTYFGDKKELELIKSGFTFVSYSLSDDIVESMERYIPQRNVNLLNMEIDDSDYPTMSFFSNEIPNGLDDIDDIANDYHFICQVYSSDFADPFNDALGLSDAIGYLFIRNNNDKIDGLFFVQTA